MNFSSVKLNIVFNGIDFKLCQGANENMLVNDIAFNTNTVSGDSLFFCVRGTVTDGHKFAEKAIDAGACALVVDHELDLNFPQVIVKDTRYALAVCSSNFFDKPSSKLDLVGITGTNGKTTTTFLVEHICNRLKIKAGVIGTVECRIDGKTYPTANTTPESRELQEMFALMIKAGCKVCAMEVSSHALCMGRLESTKFKIGAFTNLTQDHLDFHKDMQDYFNAKLKLFSDFNLDSCVVCTDSEYGKRVADECRKANSGKLITVGSSASCDLRITNAEFMPHSTSLQLAYDGHVIQIALPLVGKFNVENAIVACGIGIALGFDFADICDALEFAPQVPGRIERVIGKDGKIPSFGVLVDYAHTPDAISNVISSLKSVTKGRIICVFGCGGDRDRSKRPKMAQAACQADIAVVTTDNPRTEDPNAIIEDILEGVKDRSNLEVVVDRREAISYALKIARPCDAVLIAGKGHEDYQDVMGVKHHFDDREVAAEELERI